MKRINLWLLILAAATAFSAYIWVAQRAQRLRLTAHLMEMQQVLDAENTKAAGAAAGTVKGIEASVLKNQSQPREVAILRTCQALQARTAALLDTLHELQALAISQSGFRPSLAPSDASAQLWHSFDVPTASGRALSKHFAAYRTAMPAPFADSFRVQIPKLNGQPTALALASIAQTESNLLNKQQRVLRHFSGLVGAKKIAKKLLAVATAESNVVRPGETYRARLFLIKQLSLPHGTFYMTCNGQRVEVNPQGVGHVRFRAPNRIGPASWNGTIRFNINGRDTTFQVRVPYRVAWR